MCHQNRSGGNTNSTNGVTLLPCGAGLGKGVHVREVLPGDPDPDVVMEVIAEMKTQLQTTVISTLLARDWISRLEGKQ